MKNRDFLQQQPPPFDLGTLDTHHEIRFDYDRNGRLKSIRKERRMNGCLNYLVILGFLFILFALFVLR